MQPVLFNIPPPPPPPLTIFAIPTLLLATLPLSLTEPVCQRPPPAYVANLTDCLHLVDDIFAISAVQDDEPVLGSRNPSAFVRNRRLPYSCTDPFETDDCEFIVEVLREGSYATFPTKLVAEQADQIVEKCMKRGIDGAATIGAVVVVGPERVVVVVF